VRTQVGDEIFIIAEALVEKVLGEGAHIISKCTGADLVGQAYTPLFDYLANEMKSEERANAFKIYVADFVTTTDGTGIVHTAVMYGEDDYQLGHKIGLPKIHTVGEDGKFLSFVTKWTGKFVKSETIAKEIIADLADRELLLRAQPYEHEYPFCWRCSTPLLYYAKNSWFIRMSELSAELQARNQTIHWVPDHIRDGRFGEWLKNVKDWSLSRERYWGTPLPIWQCGACAQFDVLGSSAEIAAHGMVAPEDLHRPYVDEISYACACGAGQKTRVKEVADCWFDSGAMFVAQWGYQWGAEGEAKKNFESHYPADYISEAIDQTRGWFYTLVAVATALELPAPFKNVVCISHILDGKGVKMSKSKGNIVDPWEIFNEFGADPARFFMYATSQPGDPKLFDKKSVDEVVKKVFLILWNVLEFYKLYAGDGMAERNTNHPLDAWLEARLQKSVNYVTEQLDAYELTNGARELMVLVTDVSTWYVRRSRNRFKNGGADAASAAAMLRHALITIAKLFAPFTPMLADALHREIVGAEHSVHLEDWPATNVINEAALEQMDLMRMLVTQALEQRAKSGIPIRQILGKLIVPHTAAALAPLFEILQEEINVEAVEVGDALTLDTKLTPELREKGMVRELIRHVNAARKDAGLNPGQHAIARIVASPEVRTLLEKHQAELQHATVCTFECVEEIDGAEISVGESKVKFKIIA
jgi:isoleucyl-tRNA synthetase